MRYITIALLFCVAGCASPTAKWLDNKSTSEKEATAYLKNLPLSEICDLHKESKNFSHRKTLNYRVMKELDRRGGDSACRPDYLACTGYGYKPRTKEFRDCLAEEARMAEVKKLQNQIADMERRERRREQQAEISRNSKIVSELYQNTVDAHKNAVTPIYCNSNLYGSTLSTTCY